MKKICIVMVATNNYFPLGIRFINRWSYLYNGNMETEFHFYSDKDPLDFINKEKVNIQYHPVVTQNWKNSDMSRVLEISKMEDHSCDYIYIFDADTNIEKKFDNYLLNEEMLGYEHYGWEDFITDKDSSAYFDVTENDIYYQTCLLGGEKNKVVNMCKECIPWFENDSLTGNTPKFISEAYFNKYLHFNSPSKVIRRGEKIPFIMTDKGNKGDLFSGVDKKPFYNLSDSQYQEMLDDLKNKKDNLIDIEGGKIIIQDANSIESFVY